MKTKKIVSTVLKSWFPTGDERDNIQNYNYYRWLGSNFSQTHNNLWQRKTSNNPRSIWFVYKCKFDKSAIIEHYNIQVTLNWQCHYLQT
jgi:hypothetical protein